MKGEAKATQRGEVKWDYEPGGSSPEDIGSSWKETMDRFIWKMLEIYYFRPAGRSVNPETAFDQARKAMDEDLYRSVSDFFYRDCDRLPTPLLPGDSHWELRSPKPRWTGRNPGYMSNT